ncbi:MAG: hypothetical protein EYC70_15910 [Planctomycetota bacterium]|nr:MAG: hypothetical protein EYC70_15910 [Planctomycetota bacterium]
MPKPRPRDLLLAAAGAMVPPAVLEGGLPELDLRSFPAGTEHLRLPFRGGERVEGVFVPADPGAPVVLHYLPAEGSVTYGTRHLRGHPSLWQLRDLGFASVMLDYRGVGASNGRRSPRNIPGDALAAWEVALERAGGDPRRVLVRASSLGTLAAAALFAMGRRPAGVILIAPVRAETVARNWARHYHPRTLGRLPAALMRATLSVDIVLVVAGLRVPALVYAPRSDYLLPDAERLLLEEAVAQVGGTWVPSRYGHPALVFHACTLFDAERAFYRRLFPQLPPLEERVQRTLRALPAEAEAAFAQGTEAQARLRGYCATYLLDPPQLAAALASAAPPAEAEAPLLHWVRGIPIPVLQRLPLAQLEALLVCGDGVPPPAELAQLLDYLIELRGRSRGWWTESELLALARSFGPAPRGRSWEADLLRAAGLGAALRQR